MELKDVLHYYIGQKCKVISVSGNISAFLAKPEEIVGISYVTLACVYDSVMVVKPILRKIDSLTDEECITLASFVVFEPHFINPFIIRNDFGDRIVYWGIKDDEIEKVSEIDKFNADAELVWSAEQFHYILSIGIDLFGLIENNHAIDKATL